MPFINFFYSEDVGVIFESISLNDVFEAFLLLVDGVPCMILDLLRIHGLASERQLLLELLLDVLLQVVFVFSF